MGVFGSHGRERTEEMSAGVFTFSGLSVLSCKRQEAGCISGTKRVSVTVADADLYVDAYARFWRLKAPRPGR
jgi:hypothetical protein